MLLAHLRGVLEPDYPQGLRSALRENILLEAISLELDSKSLELQLLTQSNYISLMNPSGAKNLMQSQQTSLQNLRHLFELDGKVLKKTTQSKENDTQDIVDLYLALEKAGLVGDNAQDIPEPKT